MGTCGSFSSDAYQAFTNGIQNPSNFMVMAPAAHSAPTHTPQSFFMDEDMEDDHDDEEGWEDEEEEFEPNARMAMGQLRSMAKDIMDILSEITPDDYLEPWVAAKITMSKQNLSAVADYLQYNDDYSEGTYDYKRCVTPDGEFYGVPNRKKCVSPNRLAQCTTDSECQKMYGGTGDPEPEEEAVRSKNKPGVTLKVAGGKIKAQCTTDSECQRMFGGTGDPEPRVILNTPGGKIKVRR